MQNLSKSEVMQLVVTGGEPMIYPELLTEVLRMASAFGIGCSVNTNLTLVTPEIAQVIKESNAGVLTSMLSYDPAKHDVLTNSKGSHERLLKGIKTMHAANVTVSVNMVVMKQNLSDVYETGAFVHELGVKSFTSTKVCPSLGDDVFENLRLSKEDNIRIFNQLLDLREKLGLNVDTLTAYPSCLTDDWSKYGDFLVGRSCSAGKTFCAIGSNGQLRACVQHDKEYGDAVNEPITSIWERLSSWRDGSYLPKVCKECQYLSVCGAGCRATCQFLGDIKSVDPDTGNIVDFKPKVGDWKKVALVDVNYSLLVNTHLKSREESFGTVLTAGKSKVAVVTKDTTSLVKILSQRSSFTLNDIFEEFSLDPEKTHNFFSMLFSKGIFLKVSN